MDAPVRFGVWRSLSQHFSLLALSERACLLLLLPAALTIPLPATGEIVISELDLANSKVELVNIGATDIDLTGYRWCNRVNESPFYPNVSAGTINAGQSTATGPLVQPVELITFDLTSSFLPVAGGELGLYLPTGSFGSRAALVDYLNYGTSSGVRDTAAAGDPPIWVLDTSIDISSMGPGDTIQLSAGAPGNGVADYAIAPATIGVPQSLPPADSDNDGLPDSVETKTGTWNGPNNTGTDPNNPKKIQW